MRDQIKVAFSIWPFAIDSISLRFPCGLLDGNREVVIADTEIWEPLSTSKGQRAIHDANILVLSVDANGVTSDLATLIKSSYYLQKVVISPETHRYVLLEVISNILECYYWR